MKKLLILLLISTGLMAEMIYTKSQYNNCDKEKMSSFILKCLENANPKSDEEPEDWMPQCKNMSIDLYCTEVKYGYYYSWPLIGRKIDCDCRVCIDRDAVRMCKQYGWK